MAIIIAESRPQMIKNELYDLVMQDMKYDFEQNKTTTSVYELAIANGCNESEADELLRISTDLLDFFSKAMPKVEVEQIIEVGFIDEMDITVIFDITKEDDWKLINYYHGQPEEKLTAEYIKLA